MEPQESILLALEAEVKGTCSPLKIGLLLKCTVSKRKSRRLSHLVGFQQPEVDHLGDDSLGQE